MDTVLGGEVKVIVIAPQPVSSRLAGPNIRAIAIARRLASRFDTTLAVPDAGSDDPFCGDSFRTRRWNRNDIAGWMGAYDVVISQGTQYPAHACLRTNGRRPVQVFDLYNPLLFENIRGDAKPRTSHLGGLTGLLLQRADYLLCASERQRDLWLGGLYLCGRVDHGMDLIGIVPFGHDGTVPHHTRAVLREVHAGIDANDKLLLWGGGLWSWLDPSTLIRATARATENDRRVKLVFLGASQELANARRARNLASELGLLDRQVLFLEEWVPFEERHNYLLESDLAVCTARAGPENDFSFRARLVDAIWAGLPVVCTEGGAVAEFIERNGAGLTVGAGDVEGLSAAILAALERNAQAGFRQRIAHCRDELEWGRCLRPLVEFCERVERGEYVRPGEPPWRPWLQYAQYKLPALLGRIR